MHETMIDTPSGRFAVRSAGADDAPVALMLHGFPDDASTFDTLGQSLADQSYRAVAPYLRGYAPSPLDGPLSLDAMVADLLALVDVISPNRPICFVGHDYGAQIGYLAMTRAPERFAAAVMLAGAHPAAINRTMKRLPRQWWMSRYIIFFQFGGIADRAVARNDFAYVERLWRRWSPGFTPPAAHVAHVKATLRRSMPAPVAMYREGGFDVPDDSISVPTLFIAGEKDGCLLPRLSDGQEAIFTSGYERQQWPDVGHFPHLEQPQRTAKAALEWFQKTDLRGEPSHHTARPGQ